MLFTVTVGRSSERLSRDPQRRDRDFDGGRRLVAVRHARFWISLSLSLSLWTGLAQSQKGNKNKRERKKNQLFQAQATRKEVKVVVISLESEGGLVGKWARARVGSRLGLMLGKD